MHEMVPLELVVLQLHELEAVLDGPVESVLIYLTQIIVAQVERVERASEAKKGVGVHLLDEVLRQIETPQTSETFDAARGQPLEAIRVQVELGKGAFEAGKGELVYELELSVGDGQRLELAESGQELAVKMAQRITFDAQQA